MSASTTIRLRNPSSFYFGKISSRGDFVKSATGTKVIALIDQWIAYGMEMLLAEPGWKAAYDGAGPVDFLFIGTCKKLAISGCLTPSNDASSRRFPFVAATMFEIDDALHFLPFSTLVLDRHTNHQRALIHHASRAQDATDSLMTLNEVPFEATFPKDKLTETYQKFLVTTSLVELQGALCFKDDMCTLRQLLLAIGYLLQPLLTNYDAPPQKALAFPLPRDPAKRSLVKALWLDLTAMFLQRAGFELSIFSCMHFGTPKLIVAFNGATPTAFHALFNEYAAAGYLIDISHAEWVDDLAAKDAAVFKLASYLSHDNLSLQHMMEAFRQGFTG